MFFVCRCIALSGCSTLKKYGVFMKFSRLDVVLWVGGGFTSETSCDLRVKPALRGPALH